MALSPVQKGYSASPPYVQPLFKKILSQQLETLLDFSDTLGNVHDEYFKPHHQNVVAGNTQVSERFDAWLNELNQAGSSFRKTLSRIVGDLKYIVASSPKAESLFDALENVPDNLRASWDTDLPVRNSIEATDNKIQSVLKILYPNSRRIEPAVPASPTFHSPARPAVMAREVESSPVRTIPSNMQGSLNNQRPSFSSGPIRPPSVTSSTIMQPSQTTRYYYIDPVTGERREKLDSGPQRSVSPSPPPAPVRIIQQPSPPPSTHQSILIPSHSQAPPQSTTSSSITTVYNHPQQSSPMVIPPSNQTSTTYVSSSQQPLRPSPSPIPMTSSTYTPVTTNNPPMSTTTTTMSSMTNQNTPLDQETRTMVDEAKRDFGRPLLESVALEDAPSRVEVAADGTRVWWAGQAVGHADTVNGWVVYRGNSVTAKSRTLKSFAGGNILLDTLENSADLVFLDANYIEKGRLPGAGYGNTLDAAKAKTRCADDEEHILWLSGPEHLSVVNTSAMVSKEIRQFWRLGTRNVTPVACAIGRSGKKILGIGSIDRGFTLHFYDGSDSVVVYKREDVHDRCNRWESLEIGVDEEYAFIGGANENSATPNNSDGCILGLTFDENADAITEHVLPGSGVVSALRRHKEGDILFAGTARSVYVLFYRAKRLHLLNQINVSSVVDRPILDLAYNDQDQILYTANGTNTGAVIYLDQTLLGRRQPSNRPAAQPPRVKRLIGQKPTKPAEITPLIIPNGGPLTYQQRMAQVKKMPVHAANFGEFAIKQIGLPNTKLQRVQVSPDQSIIYCGQTELKVLQLKAGQYTLLNKGKAVKSFIDIKLLPTGELIVFDESTSDLIKYDRELQEVKRLSGKKPVVLEGSEIVTTLYRNAHKIYLWMCGDNSVGLVTPNDFQCDLLTNFFGGANDRINPFTVIASDKMKKALGVYVFEKQGAFVYMTPQGLVRHLQSKVLKGSRIRSDQVTTS